MSPQGLYKPESLQIVKLIITETGTYNPMYSRPYQTELDGQTQKILVDRVMSSPNQQITGNMLSGLASAFITPSATPEAGVNITSGWGEKRCRFIMEAIVSYAVGTTVKQYIQGYTDHVGVNMSGAVSPDMEFYVNSVTTTRVSSRMTPMGMQTIEQVVENNQVLADNNFGHMYQPGQNRLMRPQDVFSNIASSHLPGNFQSDGGPVGMNNLYDSRTVLKSEAVKSQRANCLPGTYAAKLLNSYAKASAGIEFNQNETDIVEQARGFTMESIAARDPLMAALTTITNRAVSNRFTMRELLMLDPTVGKVTNIAVSGHTQKVEGHQAGQTAFWGSTDRSTQAAAILSQAVTALMMDLMISKIVFKASNHEGGNRMDVFILSANSMGQMDMTQNYEIFKQRLVHEVLNDLTYGNSVSLMLQMTVDLLGETWTSISLGAEPLTDYVTPSFCDTLFVPVVTRNEQIVANMASDFDSLNQHIKAEMGNQYDRRTTGILTTS